MNRAGDWPAPWRHHVSRFTHHVSASSFFNSPFTSLSGLAKLRTSNEDLCVTYFPSSPALAIAGALASGCASTEKKLGRGMSNMTEFARLGEMRRSIEQTGLFDQPGGHYATGFIRGLTKSFARTGVGVYEVVTCPVPALRSRLHRLPLAQPCVSGRLRPDIIDDCPVRDGHRHGLQRRRRSAFHPGQPVQDLQYSVTPLPVTGSSSASIPVLALFFEGGLAACGRGWRTFCVLSRRFVAKEWPWHWKNNRPAKSTCC